MINADTLSFIRTCNARYDEMFAERCKPTETLYTRRHGTQCPMGGLVGDMCYACPCFFSASLFDVECDCPNNPALDADLLNITNEED